MNDIPMYTSSVHSSTENRVTQTQMFNFIFETFHKNVVPNYHPACAHYIL